VGCGHVRLLNECERSTSKGRGRCPHQVDSTVQRDGSAGLVADLQEQRSGFIGARMEFSVGTTRAGKCRMFVDCWGECAERRRRKLV
jgi:hypothetical protein